MRSPLISEDARLVAIDPRLNDDSDGDPPYLQIIDVDADRTRQHFDVPPGAPPEVGLARLAEATAALDAHRWLTLLTYETSNDDSVPMRQHGLGYATAREGTGEGLLVRFHEPTLTVREVGGRTLFRRGFPGWSEREPGCTFFTDLLGVWASRKLGVLVVTLGHSSSPHHCSASAETHAVRFAPAHANGITPPSSPQARGRGSGAAARRDAARALVCEGAPVKARGALPALLLAVGSIAATCHASPPEPPPAPTAMAPSAPPPEPVALAPDAAVAPEAAVAPGAAPAAQAARPPDALAIARRAWEERMRLPLLSDDARLVATNPGVDPKDGSRIILLKVVEVDSEHDRQLVTVRIDESSRRRARSPGGGRRHPQWAHVVSAGRLPDERRHLGPRAIPRARVGASDGGHGRGALGAFPRADPHGGGGG